MNANRATSKLRRVQPPASAVGEAGAPGSTSLADLFRDNLGWLQGWLRAQLPASERQEADDLVQEVLLRVLKKIEGLRDRSKFSPWLYRIAQNVVRDHRRQRGRRQPEAELVEEIVDPSDPVLKLVRRDEAEQLRQRIRDLPARYREPMILRHVEDLSPSRIAEILGITENLVQVRLFRARKMLLTGPAGKDER